MMAVVIYKSLSCAVDEITDTDHIANINWNTINFDAINSFWCKTLKADLSRETCTLCQLSKPFFVW